MNELSDTAEKLLAAAHAAILQQGYNAFSYADLSAAVGIRKASIHYHFPTKAELVSVLLQKYRFNARQMVTTGSLKITDPKAKLEAFIGYWSHCILSGVEPICLAALLAAELPSLPGEVAAEVKGHFVDLAAWLTTVFAELAVENPAIAAETFMASVHGAMLTARATGKPDMFAHITSEILANMNARK